MYGRKSFTLNIAILCIAISLLPTIFDFIGFYSETSIRQSLVNTKFEVLEKLNYFDKEARSAINNNIIKLDKEHNAALTKVEQDFNVQQSNLAKEIVDAEQTYIDETQGVSGRTTSGKIGVGPKAKELEAEVRKTEAAVTLKKKEFESNKQREIERLNKDYETKLASYQKGIEAIDILVSPENNKGLIFEVNTVSSKLDVEPEYVKFSTENVIQLAFGALTRFEITAIICFALALLLEIVDTIIVYMVRGIKKKNEIEELGQSNEDIQKISIEKTKKIVNVR
jgi:hypothetical protein